MQNDANRFQNKRIRVIWSNCGEFACKLCDVVRYSLVVAGINKQPVKTWGTEYREPQTSFEYDWAERIPPITIAYILYINA